MATPIGNTIKVYCENASEIQSPSPYGKIEMLLNPSSNQNAIPEVTSQAIVIHKRGSGGLELGSMQRALKEVGNAITTSADALSDRFLSADDFIQSLESLLPSDSFKSMKLAAYNRNLKNTIPYPAEIDFQNSRDLDEVLLNLLHQSDWEDKAAELLDLFRCHHQVGMGIKSPYVATMGRLPPEHKPQVANFIKGITDRIIAAYRIADLEQRFAIYDDILRDIMEAAADVKTLQIIALEKFHLMKGFSSEEKAKRLQYIVEKGQKEAPISYKNSDRVKEVSTEGAKKKPRYKAVEKKDLLKTQLSKRNYR